MQNLTVYIDGVAHTTSNEIVIAVSGEDDEHDIVTVRHTSKIPFGDEVVPDKIMIESHGELRVLSSQQYQNGSVKLLLTNEE